MDYKIKTCTRCSYSLPVTWTDKKQMVQDLKSLGWFINRNEVYCPECWRLIKWQYINLSISVPDVDSRS